MWPPSGLLRTRTRPRLCIGRVPSNRLHRTHRSHPRQSPPRTRSRHHGRSRGPSTLRGTPEPPSARSRTSGRPSHHGIGRRSHCAVSSEPSGRYGKTAHGSAADGSSEHRQEVPRSMARRGTRHGRCSRPRTRRAARGASNRSQCAACRTRTPRARTPRDRCIPSGNPAPDA